MTEGEIRKFIEITCGLGQDMYEAMRERGEPFQGYMTAQRNDGRPWLRGYLFEPPRDMTADEKEREIDRLVTSNRLGSTITGSSILQEIGRHAPQQN